MNEWTTDPKEILETFAAEMRANQRHYSIYGGNYAIVIPKQLREHIKPQACASAKIPDSVNEPAAIGRAEWGEGGRGAAVADRGESANTASTRPAHRLAWP